ncbi:MAG: helix-hairpin-helix domain-containing protein [Fibrobacterota bacterium]|nr:helix-hairpin-helix domain-containing protein [Fibrobacterota bacterium]
MFTRAEKGYLALTLFFLAAGSGIKAYRNVSVKLGPFPDPAFAAEKSVSARSDSTSAAAGGDSSVLAPDSLVSGDNDSSNIGPVSGSKDSAAVFSTSLGAKSKPSTVLNAGPRASNRSGKTGFSGKVNLNRAGMEELTQVKGLGEKTAKAILEYRNAHGLFQELRDLLHVKGIGEKKLEKLMPFLIL